MVRDLLEESSYELERVHEMFAMSAPEYEDYLRRLGERLLRYRNEVVVAIEHLEKMDRMIYEDVVSVPEEFTEHVVLAIECLQGELTYV